MSVSRAALLVAASLAFSAPAWPGAFVFSDNTGLPINSITHPKTFVGSGGTLTNTVCLNTNVLPSGVSAATVEATLRKAIRTWNRQRQVTANISLPGGNNDTADFSSIDYESTLLHEMGHCIGLAHPNLASESGLNDPDRNSTQARRGVDGVFDINDGADNRMGSSDDLRDDDVNRYWFRIGSNDPMTFPSIIDPSTFSINLGVLPAGHTYAANGDRDVLAALGYANTESVMQQGQFNDETQRRITPEDQATLRIGMAGLNETQGNSDDYTLSLLYGGQVTSNSCDINVTFGASFAVCSIGGSQFGSFPNHLVITSAVVEMGQTTNWYFSPIENTSVAASATPSAPTIGSTAAINVSVDRLSSAMTGTPSGNFEASVNAQTCTGSLAPLDSNTSTGSCNLAFNTSGAQTVSVLYLGNIGFDASVASFGVTVGAATPTVTINSDNPDPSVVGQSYSVVVSVTGSAGTPTGSVAVSDGAASCNITLSSGSGNCNLTSTTAGAKTLTANYGGNSTYATASDAETHTVNKATPAVTITGDLPDPSLVGEAYNVTFTVSGAGATPTGSVQIDDGSVNCSATLSAGAGSCMLTSTSSGAKTLTAAYAGDANYTNGSDTEAHTVNKRTPTVSITSDDPDPSVLGNAFTVAVSVSGNGTTPTGSVSVGDGAVSCNVTLSAGSGSCALTPTSAGAKTVTANYGGDTTYNTGSDTEAHTVNKATPTVTITSDNPDPSTIGQTYTVAVTVAGGVGTPTGAVSVGNGAASCNITLSAGSGSCDLVSSTDGAKTLTADYAGNASYNTASDTESHTVNKATPVVTISSDNPDPSVVGQSYSVVVSVTGSAGTPTGSVSVSDGAASCNITLSSGSGNCNLTSTTAGAKTLTANYGGNSTYAIASDTETHTVNKATPAVTITGDLPDPSLVGEVYNVTFTVSGAGATPTGSVQIGDGSVNCSATLSAGAGSCMLASTSSGVKTLTAAYAGDANYTTGSDTESHTVNKRTPTVSITSDDPDPSVLGNAFTVVVSVIGNGGTPTGSVSVGDGAVSCNITLSAGTGNCQLTPTSAGAKTLTANYGGDVTYNTGSDTESHTVNKATPTVTISSDNPDPSAVGQAYTVAVTVSGGVGTPTGAVSVSDGTATCSITLSSGSGSCGLTSSTAGAKILSAEYAGNASYNSASDTESHTVSKAAPTVTITGDLPDPSFVGEAYNVTFTVSGPGVTPTGTVQVDDGIINCSATLSAGAGSCMLTSTSSGAKTLTANYAGDGNYTIGSDTEAHTVNKRTPTVSITSDNPDPSVLGNAFTVAVSVSGNGATPTGTVSVGDGAVSCNITLSAGSGSCNLTPTSAGAKTLTANYGGDATYNTGSDTEAHTVSKATPTVLISGIVPSPSTVGQAFAITVTVSGGAGTATGSVNVGDGATTCMITLSAGSGSCNLTSATAGNKTITANYSGDASYNTGSDTESHTVSTGTPLVTINSVLPASPVLGATLSVGVAVSGGGVLPTGSVTVSISGQNCAIGLAGGSGSCTLQATAVGPQTLSASYAGDANYATAMGSTPVTVGKAASTVTINSISPNQPLQTLPYTVQIAVTGPVATPSGNVTVGDGESSCSVALIAGAGSCALTPSTVGPRTVTATFNGDANFLGDSETTSVTVVPLSPFVFANGFEG